MHVREGEQISHMRGEYIGLRRNPCIKRDGIERREKDSACMCEKARRLHTYAVEQALGLYAVVLLDGPYPEVVACGG